MRGLRPISVVRRLVEDFENASGLQINISKCKWIPCRSLTKPERQGILKRWPGAQIADQDVVLGVPVGRNVKTDDFYTNPMSSFLSRVQTLSGARLSLGMRILVCNIYLLPFLSYVNRVVLMPMHLLKEVENIVLRWFTPVPFCKLRMLRMRSLY